MPGQIVLLVEDLMTDGMSKVSFVEALREAGGEIDHAVVIFNYGVYPNTETNLSGVNLTVHALTDWRTTLEVAERRGDFDRRQVNILKEFLEDPPNWSRLHGGTDE